MCPIKSQDRELVLADKSYIKKNFALKMFIMVSWKLNRLLVEVISSLT